MFGTGCSCFMSASVLWWGLPFRYALSSSFSEQMQMLGLFQYQKKRIRKPGNLRLLKANLIASNYTTYQEEINENILENIDPQVHPHRFFSKFSFFSNGLS